MKKPLLFAILIVAVALFTASCGGTTTTTGPAATTPPSATPTTAGTTTSVSTATSETTATTAASTVSSTAQGGQLVVQLTGGDMVPPVVTSNSGILTLSLQGTSISYMLQTQGLQPSDVTSAGIYIATQAGGTSTTAAAASTTTAGSGGTTAQQGEMVIDLLAGQTGGSTGGSSTTMAAASTTTTMAAGSTGSTAATVPGEVVTIAQGTLSEQNFVGSWAGKSLTDIIGLISGLGGSQSVWAQINTQQNPNGELRGYIDIVGLIQQMMGGGAATTPSS